MDKMGLLGAVWFSGFPQKGLFEMHSLTAKKLHCHIHPRTESMEAHIYSDLPS